MSRKLQREILVGNETKEGRLRRLDFIHASSQILDLTFDLAVATGELDVEMKRKVKGWGFVDSILLYTACSTASKQMPKSTIRKCPIVAKERKIGIGA